MFEVRAALERERAIALEYQQRALAATGATVYTPFL